MSALNITPCAKIGKNRDSVVAVCSITGITIGLDLPMIPNKVLEYINPIASYKTTLDIISEGSSYLGKLETEILAGMFLSIYGHYNLVSGHGSAIEANKMLRTAGARCLIEALSIAKAFTVENTGTIPSFSIEWVTHQDSPSILPALQSYIKTCKEILFGIETETADRASVRIIGSMQTRKLGKYEVVKTQRQAEQEANDELKLAKIKGKELINRIVASKELPEAIINYLNIIFSKRNLFMLADNTRTDMCAKLRMKATDNCIALASIIESTVNPYDLFGSIDDELERASDSFTESAITQHQAKRSLAEILASKKPGTMPVQPVNKAIEISAQEAEKEYGLTDPEFESLEELEEDIMEEEALAELGAESHINDEEF